MCECCKMCYYNKISKHNNYQHAIYKFNLFILNSETCHYKDYHTKALNIVRKYQLFDDLSSVI